MYRTLPFPVLIRCCLYQFYRMLHFCSDHEVSDALEAEGFVFLGSSVHENGVGECDVAGVFLSLSEELYVEHLSESFRSFDASVDFAIRHKFLLANFNPLTPMPGAKLYDTMLEEGRLLHDRWWLDPDFRYGDATLRPLHMTPDELTAGCFAARSRFNTWRSITNRLGSTINSSNTPVE